PPSSRSLAQRREDLFGGDRQIGDLYADGVVDGVGDRRSGGNRAVLANLFCVKRARAAVISHIERFMLRYVTDVGQLVLAQIGGNDLAVFGDEIFAHREAETLDHAAFDLSAVGERVEDGSDVV